MGKRACATVGGGLTSFQAIRYITFFEKIIKLFETSETNQNIDIGKIEDLIVPGYIFDQIFLHESMCPDQEGILVEF